MSTVTLTTTGTTLSAATPYHPEFPARARALGGKWNASGKTWNFDVRDESRVRALCIEFYGTDGSPAAEADLVTLRVALAEDDFIFQDRGPLFFAGREIAHAYGRDSGARLGDKIVFIQGNARSGGSVKNWDTRTTKGAIFEIRDIPRAIARKAIETRDGWQAERFVAIEIVESDDQGDSRRQALEAEREALLARLSEIDAELGTVATPAPEAAPEVAPAPISERRAAGLLALLATAVRESLQELALQLQSAARAAAYPGQIELAL